jgi:transcriptional regulator with XRE-family HTH domain
MMNRAESAGEYKLELGRYIRGLREKRGMTQADLAKAVGMTYYTAISAIEVGRNTLPPERYLAFSRALGVPPKPFMRRILQLTNPWAAAMLFSEDADKAFASLASAIPTRLTEDQRPAS